MSTTHTVSFYNIENLFDTVDDVHTNDDAFLPNADKRWTKKRYKKKIRKLSQVISQIGEDNIDMPPAIVGLAEVENKKVVEDLINGKFLKHYNYGIVHHNSPDERGIDVALIYNKDVFEVTHSEPFSVYIEKEDGTQDFTRDILLVTGHLQKQRIHLLINHWSSRREGVEETNYKRLAAANTVNRIIRDLNSNYNDPQIIVMGDFNDTPQSESLLTIENTSSLFNPFKTISTKDRGTLNHFFEWMVFDQILISTNFFNVSKTPFDMVTADVFDSKFLTQYHGKFKGQPYRTYVGKRYKGGYSDHFPVYISLKLNS